MTNKPDVTIIIPAHNEEEGIADVINGVKGLNTGYEIIVVDDGSTDNTYKLAAESGVKVIRHPYNKGYGAALKTGIRNAEADVVFLWMQMGSTNPVTSQPLCNILENMIWLLARERKNQKYHCYEDPGKRFLA
jgi:cellulose synthase/poly-beta-1,6-N-acetylglucosamine synthase-like glycosyltransferase